MLPSLGEAEGLDYRSSLIPAPFLRQVSSSTHCPSPVQLVGLQPPALLTQLVIGRGIAEWEQVALLPLFLLVCLLFLLVLGREVSREGTRLFDSGICPLEIRVLQEEHLRVEPVGQKAAVGHSQLRGCGTGAMFQHNPWSVPALWHSAAWSCSCPSRAGSAP